jgi:thymidine kinase
MNFLKKLASLFSAATPRRADDVYIITAQCNRCGEIIQAHLNLANDVSADYGEDGSTATYLCRKVLVGKQRCFQPIEVVLTFDAQRKLTDRQITGGKFLDE